MQHCACMFDGQESKNRYANVEWQKNSKTDQQTIVHSIIIHITGNRHTADIPLPLNRKIIKK